MTNDTPRFDLPTEQKAIHVQKLISEIQAIKTPNDTELHDAIMKLRDWKRTHVNFNDLSRTEVETIYKAGFPNTDTEWVTERSTEELLVTLDPDRSRLEHEGLADTFSESVRNFHEEISNE